MRYDKKHGPMLVKKQWFCKQYESDLLLIKLKIQTLLMLFYGHDLSPTNLGFVSTLILMYSNCCRYVFWFWFNNIDRNETCDTYRMIL